ncbi:hypothetical protein NC652_032441 [Populus alba x Populus x berolinensis]|uniref:Uncharacterized protein n=1 Tax=Populus alba x Populus x berolinensis TaxID=444605 RepID=A0AAD6PZ10_9ROSI|nr:hypothetical protein NC652_032441 [Populus alba x Populus x berolinensis]KAJ6971825.1 hypothetical protein NC653_032386 [Populus alba x Populus x berolinensis]
MQGFSDEGKLGFVIRSVNYDFALLLYARLKSFGYVYLVVILTFRRSCLEFCLSLRWIHPLSNLL